METVDTAPFSPSPQPSGKGQKCLKKPRSIPQLIFTRRRSLVRVQQSPPKKIPDFARNQGFFVLFGVKSCYVFFGFPVDHIKYHSCDFPVTTSLCARSPIFAYCVTDFDMPRRQSSGQNPAKWRLYCRHFAGFIFAKSQDIFLLNRRFFLNLTCPYAII